MQFNNISPPTSLSSDTNLNFNNLVQSSLQVINNLTQSEDTKEVLQIKSAVMHILDKIGNLKGNLHTDTLIASNYTWGAGYFGSLAIAHAITEIKRDPSFNKESAAAFDTWLKSESECQQIALILDAWASKGQEILLAASSRNIKNPAISMDSTTKAEPSKEEVNVLIEEIIRRLDQLQPGNCLKIPAGTLKHFTRLHITKNENDTFEIVHFDTDNLEMTLKYPSIPSNTLLSSEFWEKFIETKMQMEMDKVNKLLKDSAGILSPMPLPKITLKPKQLLPSCSLLSVEADLKYSLITYFKDPNIGWEIYKQYKYKAAQITKSRSCTNANVQRMLFAKELIRCRYQEWINACKDPIKFTHLREAYIASIEYLYPNQTAEILESIAKLSPLRMISTLDKALNALLKNATYSQLEHVRKTYGGDCTFNGVNYLGIKEMMWIEYTRVLLREYIDSKDLKGQIFSTIRAISASILPSSMDAEIQNELSLPFLDPTSLTAILCIYCYRENPLIIRRLLNDISRLNVTLDFKLELFIESKLNEFLNGEIVFKNLAMIANLINLIPDLKKRLTLIDKITGKIELKDEQLFEFMNNFNPKDFSEDSLLGYNSLLWLLSSDYVDDQEKGMNLINLIHDKKLQAILTKKIFEND